MARRHLAIFLRGVAEKILSGEKIVEVRLSQNRILPYNSVSKDDIIFLKNSGGKIIGRVVVDNCLYYDNINKVIFEKIKNQYQEAAKIDESFWTLRKKAKFATIIFLKNPKKFLTEVIYKKKDRRAWVIIEEEK